MANEQAAGAPGMLLARGDDAIEELEAAVRDHQAARAVAEKVAGQRRATERALARAHRDAAARISPELLALRGHYHQHLARLEALYGAAHTIAAHLASLQASGVDHDTDAAARTRNALDAVFQLAASPTHRRLLNRAPVEGG